MPGHAIGRAFYVVPTQNFQSRKIELTKFQIGSLLEPQLDFGMYADLAQCRPQMGKIEGGAALSGIGQALEITKAVHAATDSHPDEKARMHENMPNVYE